MPDEKINWDNHANTENDTFTVVEGRRRIANCDDPADDIALEGDVLKVFYTLGADDLPTNFSTLILDLSKRSLTGSAYITLRSNVQEDPSASLEKFSSSSLDKSDSNSR